jgi:hypothetical protein
MQQQQQLEVFLVQDMTRACFLQALHHSQLSVCAASFVMLFLCYFPCPPVIPAAAKLEDVYGEIFKALKPGGLFLSYEWVSTKDFDASNPEHVRIIDEINFGNGLPEMRTWQQAEDAGKAVGFKLVTR